MKSLFKRYKYVSPNVSNIEYFRNPSLHHGVGLVGSWKAFFAKTLKQKLYKNRMRKKGLHGVLSTTKQKQSWLKTNT